MRNPITLIVAFIATVIVMPSTAIAESANVGMPIQAETVADAVSEISGILERRGYDITLVVDHAAGAASVGLELPPTQVIFARPPQSIERGLLKRSDTVGIDLPVKVLAFERDGMVHITSNATGYLTDRNDVNLKDGIIRPLDATLDLFDSAATGLVTLESLQNLDDTVLSLEAAISANTAFRIPLVLNYSENGKGIATGQTDGPVLIVFGNPNAGTPLMQTQREIAIDLPQKFLVWEDNDGTVNITYNDPFFIADRHDVEGQDTLLDAIANALRQFALAGAGQDTTQ